MRNILICPDIHFCQYYSLIDQRGEKYSARLENCIKSVNWVMDTALKNNCSSIFYLGDFFDKSTLNAEEITALSSINFDIGINQFIIVGNHEAKTSDNIFNSTNCLQKLHVFDSYQVLEDDRIAIHLLPYMYDCQEDLTKIITPINGKKNIVLSHNDLCGVNYGTYLSKSGLSLDSIEKCCDLFISGHIHNNFKISDKIINLGSLTGKNFNEDCTKYVHQVAILDLDTLNLTYIENPYAFNFYKIPQLDDYNTLVNFINSSDKNNLVLHITCNESIQLKVKELLENLKITGKVFTYKIITERTFKEVSENTDVTLIKINPYQDLRDCVLKYVDDSEYTKSELDIICS